MRSVPHRVPRSGNTCCCQTANVLVGSASLYGDPRTQAFAELMIDLEESPHARAVVLGELRERELRGEP